MKDRVDRKQLSNNFEQKIGQTVLSNKLAVKKSADKTQNGHVKIRPQIF